MFMNKKLSALWDKYKAWRKSRREAALVKLIAKECNDEGAGTVKSEAPNQWGIDPAHFADFKMKLGSHCVEKGVYIRRDGSPLIYPMKIKHNDGSVDIIKIFTAEENSKLAAEESVSMEMAAAKEAYKTYRQNGGTKSQMEFVAALDYQKFNSVNLAGD